MRVSSVFTLSLVATALMLTACASSTTTSDGEQSSETGVSMPASDVDEVADEPDLFDQIGEVLVAASPYYESNFFGLSTNTDRVEVLVKAPIPEADLLAGCDAVAAFIASSNDPDRPLVFRSPETATMFAEQVGDSCQLIDATVPTTVAGSSGDQPDAWSEGLVQVLRPALGDTGEFAGVLVGAGFVTVRVESRPSDEQLLDACSSAQQYIANQPNPDIGSTDGVFVSIAEQETTLLSAFGQSACFVTDPMPTVTSPATTMTIPSTTVPPTTVPPTTIPSTTVPPTTVPPTTAPPTTAPPTTVPPTTEPPIPSADLTLVDGLAVVVNGSRISHVNACQQNLTVLLDGIVEPISVGGEPFRIEFDPLAVDYRSALQLTSARRSVSVFVSEFDGVWNYEIPPGAAPFDSGLILIRHDQLRPC